MPKLSYRKSIESPSPLKSMNSELEGGGVHLRGYSNLKKNGIHQDDGERDPSPSAQETLVVRVQIDRHAKTKEPGFRYTA
ncbi:unnamed protein product [Spirodela intermedia]|uniref:Uncharacterized protein n=1 Tax=Spirodela intermedia TaxID=51605 RepID=A0A7I8L8N0_SPIIN|nr:unnamed protein product [Spirodela intermedia]